MRPYRVGGGVLVQDIDTEPQTPVQTVRTSGGYNLFREEVSQEHRSIVGTTHIPASPFDLYLLAAVRQANIKRLDDGTWYADIPQLQGVWANHESPLDMLEELREVLMGWLILKIQDADRDIPVLDEVDLNVF